MVTVTGYQEKTSSEGKTYFSLELQSDELEFVVSKNTGKFYATVRKCWISSTFNESLCKMMIGKTIQGSITKVECEPYSFTVEESGEEITRYHRYEYVPVESQDTERIVVGKEEVA